MNLTSEQLNKINSATKNRFGIEDKTIDEQLEIIDRVGEINAKLEEVSTSEEMILIQDDERLIAVGDPNDTKIKLADYTLKFKMPEFQLSDAEKEAIKPRVDRNGWAFFEIAKKDAFVDTYTRFILSENHINYLAVKDKVDELMDELNFDQIMEMKKEARGEILIKVLTAESGALYRLALDTMLVVMEMPREERFRRAADAASVTNAYFNLIANNPGAFNEAEVFTE